VRAKDHPSIRLCFALAVIPLIAASVGRADTVLFRNGSTITGHFIASNDGAISVETDNGPMNFHIADVQQITFDAPPPPPPPPVMMPPPPPPPVGPLVVPAGTILTVRMDTQVSSKTSSGSKFSATLVLDVLAGNVSVAGAGTTVLGQVEQAKQAGRLVGKSELKLTLTALNLNGRAVPVFTTNYAEAGKGSFQKTARNAAVGAGIGAVFDGGKGAGKGAAVGVGASLIREGDSVTVPPGAILEFRLAQPLVLQ
jgi:hypothetical protein